MSTTTTTAIQESAPVTLTLAYDKDFHEQVPLTTPFTPPIPQS